MKRQKSFFSPFYSALIVLVLSLLGVLPARSESGTTNVAEPTQKTEVPKAVTNGSTLRPYQPERPNVRGFRSSKLNEKGELVVEYSKDHYEKLMKAYGGK